MENYKSWNKIVAINGSNILHTWEWIQAKKSVNQNCTYLFEDNANLQCAIPIFIKNFKYIKFGWIPQGVTYNGDPIKFNEKIQNIKKKYSLKFILTELNNTSFNNSKNIFNLINKILKIGVKKTSLLDLEQNDFTINYNKTTKKYIKRAAKKYEVKPIQQKEYKDLYKLYINLVNKNNFKPPFDYNFYKNLINICDNNNNNNEISLKNLSKKIIVNNEIINFVTVLYFKNNAIELLRYDNKGNDNKYSSRYITHKILEELKNNKVKNYDFGGIEDKNKGIKNFKLSFGGKMFYSNGFIIF